jgi:putative transposase
MPYRKEKFVNGKVYHLLLRALDNNLTFKNIDDYYRGIFSIYEFNAAKAVVIRDRRKSRSRIKNILTKNSKDSKVNIDPRDKIIEILSFCLMPNHLHLLVRQIKDGGIINFMRKFGAGYGGYFNKKYSRKGHVFQGNFKAVSIKNDEQLKTVWAYIHANPVSLLEAKWKERGIRNFKKTVKFLENYKWSSYSDYLGKNNFPSVTERKFILDTIGGQKESKKFLENYVINKGKIKDSSSPEITLE